MTIDSDIEWMMRHEHKLEISKLRAAIRLHRDEKGHDRCWLDDQRLYQVLPEATEADLHLPPREEFLANCARYWATRQPSLTFKPMTQGEVFNVLHSQEPPVSSEEYITELAAERQRRAALEARVQELVEENRKLRELQAS